MNRGAPISQLLHDGPDSFEAWLGWSLRERYQPVLAEQLPDQLLALMCDPACACRDAEALSRCEGAAARPAAATSPPDPHPR
jgi:hypothetical protein